MRVVVYGKPLQNRVLAAFMEGCAALGHTAIQRNHSVFTPDQTEPADLVAMYGWRGKSPVIAKAYADKGVRCVVIDSAYIHRDRDYHAVGVGGLNRMPDFDCPPDRLSAWGAWRAVEQGNAFLIVGQVAGDAQLPPDFNPSQWAAETAKNLKATFPKCKVIWKPHPSCEGMECAQADETRTGSLGEALAGCGTIVTYNSTAAYEALMRGVSVICDPSAVYAPHVDNPVPFLKRVAYAQWTTDEIARGEALRFLLEGVASGAEKTDGTAPDDAAPADDSRNAKAPRRNDEGRTRNARQKGVR